MMLDFTMHCCCIRNLTITTIMTQCQDLNNTRNACMRSKNLIKLDLNVCYEYHDTEIYKCYKYRLKNYILVCSVQQ